jgi:hypothetical protein
MTKRTFLREKSGNGRRSMVFQIQFNLSSFFGLRDHCPITERIGGFCFEEGGMQSCGGGVEAVGF